MLDLLQAFEPACIGSLWQLESVHVKVCISWEPFCVGVVLKGDQDTAPFSAWTSPQGSASRGPEPGLRKVISVLAGE